MSYNQRNMVGESANSIDADESARNDLPHLYLHCLHSSF